MPDSPPSPYKGLIPFEESDAELFFGRESETRLIIANLFASPLTILYGMSGVGKSSILRAGVAHQLYKRDGVLAVVFTDWETDPLVGIKEAVIAAALAKSKLAPLKLADHPSKSLPLHQYLNEWTKLIGCRLTIILDQFEDYIRYQPVDSPFAPELSMSVMQDDAPVSFIISIREDTYAKLDRFEGSIPVLFDNYLRLEPLNKEAARAAIEKPIECFNNKYVSDNEKAYSIEQSLVDTVLEQVKAGGVSLGQAWGKSGKVEDRNYRVDTVYLQLVMTRLWNEEVKSGSRILRRETLDRLDGSKSIVRTHLDGVMNDLNPEEQRVAARVFQYLVTPSGTKVAYPVDELAEYEKIDKKKLTTVLEKLSKGNNRILRVVSLGVWPKPRYEIFHDALGPAILDWRTRYVSEQERTEVLKEVELQELELQREYALKLVEKKRKQVTQLLWMVVGLVLISAFMTFVTSLALSNRRTAEKAKAEAVLQRDEAQRQKQLAESILNIIKEQDRTFKDIKAVLRGHGGRVRYVAFSSDNRYALTAGEDHTARIWDIATGEQLHVLSGHKESVTCAVFSPEGKYVATASEDNTARLWDSASGESIVEMTGHKAPLTSIMFSDNGQLLVTASSDKTARVWRVGQSQSILILEGHTNALRTADFSPDSGLVVTSSKDGTARIWDVRGEKSPIILGGHTSEVNSARFSPSGKTVVTSSKDRTVRVWDAKTGNQLKVLVGHGASVNSAEFSPDGERIVTASDDNTARIWSARTARSLSVLRGHTGKVNSAEFSPDGERVVTASDDDTARTWTAQSATKTALVEFQGHIDKVSMAVFSPDNRMVLTASDDRTARIWDASKFIGKF